MNARDQVRSTDSIISLSARLLGDPMRWKELVTLNSLRPPYLSATGGPGILKPGDEILYPAGSERAETIVSPVDSATLEAMTYRRDLATQDGDLVMHGSDLGVTVGLPNLEAALLQRIATLLGAHPFSPGYGSLVKLNIGRPADTARLLLMIDDILRAVLRDPRVESATGEAEYDTDIVYARITVTPIKPGSPLTLSIPLT